MVKRGWKIVRGGGTASYYWSGFEDRARARYYVGARTYPHLGSGPLAVFASREDASRFHARSGYAGPNTILPCVYDEIDTTFWKATDPALYRIAGRCLGGKSFFAFDLMALVELPEGTRLARWVEIGEPAK